MYYIGVDLGGTNIAVGIINENYEIIIKDKVRTGADRGPDAVISDMAELILCLTKRANISFDEIEYVGIAAPGSVDPENIVVKYANNLNMTQYPIGERLKSLIPVKKVYLENDANAAALGEAKAGAGKGRRHLIMITLGTGVGGGIVIDGKLYSGFNYCGAELGHMVIEQDGLPCTCGRKGCWESYSSATGLVNMTKRKLLECKNTVMWEMCDNDIKKVSGKTAYKAKRMGDKAGEEVVEMYEKYLATGLTNIVNIFQPDVLCIGGGVCGEGDYLLNPIKEAVDRDQYGTNSHKDKTEIVIAKLGNDAGIIGAGILGL